MQYSLELNFKIFSPKKSYILIKLFRLFVKQAFYMKTSIWWDHLIVLFNLIPKSVKCIILLAIKGMKILSLL